MPDGWQDIRLIKPKTVEAFYGHPVQHPMVACGGYVDNQLLAVWGLTWVGQDCWVFWNARPEALGFRRTILREARRLLAAARKAGETEVFSVAADVDTARRLHERLGFVEAGEKNGEKVWLWQP